MPSILYLSYLPHHLVQQGLIVVTTSCQTSSCLEIWFELLFAPCSTVLLRLSTGFIFARHIARHFDRHIDRHFDRHNLYSLHAARNYKFHLLRFFYI